MSPRVGRRTRTQAIEDSSMTEVRYKEAGRVGQGTSAGARGFRGGTTGRAAAGSLMSMGMREYSAHNYSSVLSRTLREDG